MGILTTESIKHIHCIGVGGIGLCGLAELLLARGYQVSGSDMAESKNTQRLRELGAMIFIGHGSEQLGTADAVVYSSAITSQNPEWQLAQERGLPMVKRGELLAELVNTTFGVAIAGTHGKTTTTSLTAHVLKHAGVDPSYVIGGIIEGDPSPVHVGQSDVLVAEADESDASFLYMHPRVAVITNIDADHLETYGGDFEQLKHAFVNFVHAMPPEGVVVACVDDPVVAMLCESFSRRVIRYGQTEDADVQIESVNQSGLTTNFTLRSASIQQPITLNMPGVHNVCNATAAAIIALELGCKPDTIATALRHFPGVGRRFHAHGELPVSNGSALLFDDYGHHPREIAATIHAARHAWPDRRIVLVFQPHRYSRTRDLMEEFADVLSDVDLLILLDIYSAGESPLPGVDSATLLQKIAQKPGHQRVHVPELAMLLKRCGHVCSQMTWFFCRGRVM